MDFEELAKEICLKAHEGQLDKGGHPYYLHPFKVASYGKTTEERIVGYLHDTVEDTNITLKDLENYGFSKEIVLAVDAMTHREDESYDEYLTRLSKNPLATKVKINDFINNTDLSRLAKVTHKDIKRAYKYLKYLDRLIEIDKGRWIN